MKKLTIEEKAQRYDEAIKKFDVILNLNTVKESGTIFADDVRKILPELAGSKDERIRRELIDFLEYYRLNNVLDSKTIFLLTDSVAWLEKQGEQKLLNKCMYSNDNYTDEERKILCDGCDEDCKLKQKPVEWSENDENRLNHIIQFLEDKDRWKDTERAFPIEEDVRWLKSLKERVQPQPKKEWSEDTQQWIDVIIKDYEDLYDADKDHRATIQAKINILKSLRPQSQWKPSNEQLYTLEKATHIVGSKYKSCLTSLYNDLKKLRGE